jgi:L-seryl-tRNA(Ser) seleniumtransferase
MDLETKARLRALPAVDETVRRLEQAGSTTVPRWALLQAVREAIDALRRQVVDRETVDPRLDDAAVIRRAAELQRPSLRPVINATGVVLHTNLGRAPLAADALERLREIAGGYSNLEYEVEERQRGSRHVHAAALLRELCGAEDAVVVNNNAAAVLLCLAAHARGREVVVSRGELIEIGGSFRLPEVMAVSGAQLREVGATNRTHLRDYQTAIGEQTAMLLKAHRSNFAMVGFVADVDPRELVALGRRAGVLTMYDLGSGTLQDLRDLGLPAETRVQQAVAWGFDLVTFSGDKLLGGPQAGIIVGSESAVERVRAHPLMRAVRPDKLTLGALEATLEAYRDGRARRVLPAVAMLSADERALRPRAEALQGELALQLQDPWRSEVVQVTSRVGGGALPEAELASWAVALTHPRLGAERLAAALHRGDPAVIGRIEEGRLLLDLRTVPEERLGSLIERLAGLAELG